MPLTDLSPALERRVQVREFQRKHRTALLTLVFTDMVGSTKLKQDLGDIAAMNLIRRHHELVRQTLACFEDAEEISTAGDAFFIVFVKPSDATRFCLQLQAGLRELSREVNRVLLDRLGIHIGEVVIHGDDGGPKDLYGIQVDICARVMSLAEPGQVLLTRTVFDNARQVLKGRDIPGLSSLAWLNHGPYVAKGVEEPVEICEVGEVAFAPLRPPPDSEKVHRHISADSEPVLGWRPAVDQWVPKTQWKLERKLGEGGFGEVWLGRHETLKECRVFKFCFRADRVRSLKREVTLFRILKERVGTHPNIVGVQEVFFEEPPFYIMMDYAEGQDLRAWGEAQGGLEKTPLALRLEIVAQVADALQAAHDAGIIHRDVKPSNILVSGRRAEGGGQRAEPSEQDGSNQYDSNQCGSGQEVAGSTSQSGQSSPPSPASSLTTRHSSLHVKLTDFGIGQVVSQEALAGMTSMGFTQTMMTPGSSGQSGTQMYMAPELLAGQQASPQSDIYSLGVVLFQLAIGSFSRPLTTDWLGEISDPLVREDLAKCLAGDPKKRFATAGALAASLRSFEKRQHALDQMRDAIVTLGEMRSALTKAENKTTLFIVLNLLAILSLLGWIPLLAVWLTKESVDRVVFETNFGREHNRYRLLQEAFLDSLGQSGNWIEAVERIEQAFESVRTGLADRRSPVLIDIASSLMKQGKLEEAYQVYTKALERNLPNPDKIWMLRGGLLRQMHYEEAAATDDYFAKQSLLTQRLRHPVIPTDVHVTPLIDFAGQGIGGHFIHLRPYCTASLAKNRLLGVLANNLKLVQKEPQELGFVEFEIRGAIQLAGGKIQEEGRHFPPRINGIRIGRLSPRIHFLHGSCHAAPAGTEIGSYVVHYTDGQTTEVPIVYGLSVRNWWVEPGEPKDPTALAPVWTGINKATPTTVTNQLFRITWENPSPQKEIKSIDFVSKMTPAAPFLVAITTE